MQFEKIVELVKEYESKDTEAKTLDARIRSCQSNLKRFADTGNMHIDVYFEHDKWESIYPKDVYPSDAVREAVIADIQKNINKMNTQHGELLARLLEIKNILGESEDGHVSADA